VQRAQNPAGLDTDRDPPNFRAMASFFVRSKGLQAKRAMLDIFAGRALSVGIATDFPFALAESTSVLNTDPDPREHALIVGKIHNLRLACARINNRVLRPGETFSFWRQVGPPWRSRGYVSGREVREGCVIPTIGGGLCQLSGSLLEVVSRLDFDIVERHRHTALPADVPHDPSRDATVFWNYVDLRFRAPFPVLLEASLTHDALVVRIRGTQPHGTTRRAIAQIQVRTPTEPHIESCFVCDQTGCARHRPKAPLEGRAPPNTAYLVDAYQPEFDAYIQQHKRDRDELLMPFLIDGGKRGWQSDTFTNSRSFPWFRLQRSLALRWAVSRGVTVAKAHFELAETLAKIYERRLGHDVEHVCVAQTLLPYLWKSGVLGGRTFDVLMYRYPVRVLEQQLDAACRLYPESKTLAEFRAPRWFGEAEEAALAAARSIVTPHTHMASLFDNAVRLDWTAPDMKAGASVAEKDLIVFFGPTLARKGAYAVRDAVKQSGRSLELVGSELEGADFWKGASVTRENSTALPWDRIHTVLHPALFEHWPRQLLRAHASGARLVISAACGIGNMRERVHHVPYGDVEALLAALQQR
jgi:hypothetical protein